jgi:hypothetical protein
VWAIFLGHSSGHVVLVVDGGGHLWLSSVSNMIGWWRGPLELPTVYSIFGGIGCGSGVGVLGT